YLQLVASLYGLPDGEAAARIVRFAEFFELAEGTLHRELLAAYSKGMRQKVVITAALLHNPKAIFFDEPLNGLDANAALGFKTVITSLAREGKTIIYCSHVLDVVERACERIVIMHAGRLAADGSLARPLQLRPRHARHHLRHARHEPGGGVGGPALQPARARRPGPHAARAAHDSAREGREPDVLRAAPRPGAEPASHGARAPGDGHA